MLYVALASLSTSILNALLTLEFHNYTYRSESLILGIHNIIYDLQIVSATISNAIQHIFKINVCRIASRFIQLWYVRIIFLLTSA